MGETVVDFAAELLVTVRYFPASGGFNMTVVDGDRMVHGNIPAEQARRLLGDMLPKVELVKAHVCDNCQKHWKQEQLDDIRHYSQRVGGGEEPSGQCPKCGALCYEAELEPSKVKFAKAPRKATV